jgi:small acid-soluble spore protein A (major alpha-type SASP)
MSRTNKLVVPQSEALLDQMKYEIASEFGINYGPDATARDNGRIGGEMTKRLVQMAQEQLHQ